MDSISWEVLYFRSLKTNNLLSVLTSYLLEFKKLCIPGLGSFEVVHQAAELDIADKRILPPQYMVKYNSIEKLSDHQLNYIAARTDMHFVSVPVELEKIADRMKVAAAKGFQWNGIGYLKLDHNQLQFENALSLNDAFTAVPAHKVLRENVEHTRLVGDREITAAPGEEKVAEKRSVVMVLGWLLLLIVAGVIIYFLYRTGFDPSGAGLRLKAR